MDKQQASKELAALVLAFNQALSDAEAFAIEHKLGFSISPSYGMGGYFDGEEYGEPSEYGEESDGWNPSSQSC